MEGPGPCGLQGYDMPCHHVDPASEHTSDLLCCSLWPLLHPTATHVLAGLHGCAAAAVGAHEEETVSVEWLSL